MKNTANIRVYIADDFTLNQEFVLDQNTSHYLCNVMRCNQDDIIKCFNPLCGEYSAQLIDINKKESKIKLLKKLRCSKPEPDIWLLFSPLKKDKTDFVITKAVELGVSKILPVLTQYTNAEKVRLERYSAQAVEASEQCERISVPQIMSPQILSEILKSWDSSRTLYFMDERRQGNAISTAFQQNNKKAAILVGPEGGFSPDEAELLNNCSFVKNISLGPRILRAETAVVASLAIWQALAGDWKEKD